MIPHLRRYQEFAVYEYGFTLDALDMRHPRLSFIKDYSFLLKIDDYYIKGCASI